MNRKGKAIGSVYLGEVAGRTFYYSNLAPFVERVKRELIGRSDHCFVSIGYHATFAANGHLTRLVSRAIQAKASFTMCLNCPKSYVSFRKRFPDQPCCYVSELFFFFLRYDYGSLFSIAGGDTSKDFRAVMVASRLPCKNRDLAASIPKLACLISAGFNRPETELPDAAYINDRMLSRIQINEIFHQSETAMILSFVEGACRSVLEYLLSGLPIVSMQNSGGRDVFLDSSNSITVLKRKVPRSVLQDDVRKAHEKLLLGRRLGKFSPQEIREKSIGRLKWFYERLLFAFSYELNQDICDLQPLIEKMLVSHSPSFAEVLKTISEPPARLLKQQESIFFPGV